MSTVFFFSSRRRHTRLTCDWSSDVCSSDLVAEERDEDESEDSDEEELVDSDEEDSDDGDTDEDEYIPSRKFTLQPRQSSLRSEERRVGKECRSRRSPEQ